MIKKNNISSLGFGVTNNVEITVINSETNEVKQNFTIHNKATRGMVTGLLRFMCGHFTATNCNEQPQYDCAKNYIPCFIGFGDGGILYDPTTGLPKTISKYNNTIPEIDEHWSQYVFYDTDKMSREIKVDSRSKIQKISDTYEAESTADMDSVYFECVAAPGSINGKRFGNTFVHDNGVTTFASEIGLFASNNTDNNDLLAYIKLSNYKEDPENENESLKTNIIRVRPEDTIIIRWVITIAAIGKDSILTASTIRNEFGEEIHNDVVMIPELVPVSIEEIPDT